MDKPQHYDPRDIEAALRVGRGQLADLAERLETAGPAVELSHSDKLLLWMAVKAVLLQD